MFCKIVKNLWILLKLPVCLVRDYFWQPEHPNVYSVAIIIIYKLKLRNKIAREEIEQNTILLNLYKCLFNVNIRLSLNSD